MCWAIRIGSGNERRQRAEQLEQRVRAAHRRADADRRAPAACAPLTRVDRPARRAARMADHARAAQHREAPAEGVGTGSGRVEQIDRALRHGIEGAGSQCRGRGLRVGPDMPGEHEDRHRERRP